MSQTDQRIRQPSKRLLVLAVTLVMQMGFLHAGVPAAIGMSSSCPAFSAASSLEVQGHRWTFDNRIYDIGAQGIGCAEAHRLILRAGQALNSRGAGLGVFIRVGRWQCTSYRPLTGSAGFVHWNSVCKRGGRHKLTWSAQTLRSHKSN
jgi:hypothetical protein